MPCSGIRFLVVEDHEFQRRMVVQLLRSLGASAVHDAEDGSAALRVVHDPDRPIDIVISDLSMPGMDGMEFIRHLSEAGTRVSLILASALERDLLASIANMAQAYKVRLLGVIGKPATAAKLAPLIELHRRDSPGAAEETDLADIGQIAEAWTHNEFEPWFEPRVNLTTGQVRALEVAARWRHPERGVLGPKQFMPSVRARGLNDDFVWMLLQKAIVQCRQFQRPGHPLVVSVNLAFESLTDPQVAARIRQIAERESVDPRLLTFSVTESALDTESAKALENLARLRMDGFGLAIDDFGTGAMAAEQLSLVAFTELKLKRSFVTGANDSDSARAGLAVGLEIAQRLGLKTVATGIGSKHEWTLLRDWGCDFGQGPFISGALPAQALPGWLAAWAGSTIK